jgi:hypothetical protein
MRARVAVHKSDGRVHVRKLAYVRGMAEAASAAQRSAPVEGERHRGAAGLWAAQMTGEPRARDVRCASVTRCRRRSPFGK